MTAYLFAVATICWAMPGFRSSEHGEPVTIAADAIQPHVAVSGNNVYATFIHQGNISVSVSRDRGRSFSKPVVAIDVQGRARGGAHRGPRIGVDEQNRITVTAPVTFDDEEYKRRYPTAELFATQSSDGGKTWDKPVQVNERSKKAPEALHWMAAAPTGEAHIAWLDLRDRTGPGQDLFYARLNDNIVSANEKIASDICECCAPGMAVQGNDVWIAYREGGNKPSREIFARLSRDAGQSFSQPVRLNRENTMEDG